ncbi:HpcH/HpaI aldolase family protein [Sphingobium lactosutens]|uniref:HpcH/HpaI aldolase family protein n=1 Tax=Sphingobium lactosutens TaxID=522773 RepID=UPI0015BBB74C|nr:aldolase/citrate lyase family protein [Sphingobium lactosutens]
MLSLDQSSALLNPRQTDRSPLGTFICSIDPTSVEIAARAGFDFVVVESEHVGIDRAMMINHVRAAKASRCALLVKTLDAQSATLQSFLDIGATGLVVPHVDTAAEAERLAQACRYAPAGSRGMSFACYDGKYDPSDFGARMARRNAATLLFPMIETRDGLDHVDEIAAVEGVDGLFFGPGDMANELGTDLFPGNALLTQAWARIYAACKQKGILALAPAGLGYDDAGAYTSGIDHLFLYEAYRNAVTRHRACQS